MANFSKYGKHLLKKIKNLCEGVNDHPSEANIHAFRVEVKKLKALIHLLSWYFPEMDKKKTKKLWKLFSISGAVREWQILSGEIRVLPLPEEITGEILHVTHHEENKACRNFKSNYRKSMPESLEELNKYLEDFFVRASQINMDGYFRYITEAIPVNWKEKNYSAELYHDLRKNIKELKYNLKILEEDEKRSFDLLHNPEFLNKAEASLGNWHDTIVAANQLQALAAKEELSPGAKAALTRLKKAKERQAVSALRKFKHDFNQ